MYIFLDDDDKPRLQVTDQNSDFFAKLLKQANDKKINAAIELVISDLKETAEKYVNKSDIDDFIEEYFLFL